MADRQAGMLATPHATHDLELVARAAAGDAAADELDRAAVLLATCGVCATLVADLRAITGATRSLAGSGVAIRAPRDFRLTPGDAQRLRSGGLRGRLGRSRIRSPALTARLGAGFVALGLVGVLVAGGLPGALLGQAGGTANSAATGASKDYAASPEAALAPASSNAFAGPETLAPDRNTVSDAHDAAGRSGTSPAIAFVLSIGVAVVGFALLLASRMGRRAGP